MHLFVTIVVTVIIFFSSLTMYVAIAQSRYVYHPDKSVAALPSAAGLQFEALSLTAEDGNTISAWFVPCKSSDGAVPKQVVLFCHGNAGDIGDRIGSLYTFNQLGYSTLIFDYPGYGESSGSPSESGTYSAALAAWDYLVDQRGYRPKDIIIFGRSLGGGIASWLAVQSNPGALVMESVFSSIPDMAAKMFPLLPVRLVCRIKYDNVANVARINCPVLVAHGKADHTCPYEQGRKVFAAAREPKLFVEINGAHNDGGLDSNPHYQAAFVKFMDDHL